MAAASSRQFSLSLPANANQDVVLRQRKRARCIQSQSKASLLGQRNGLSVVSAEEVVGVYLGSGQIGTVRPEVTKTEIPHSIMLAGIPLLVLALLRL